MWRIFEIVGITLTCVAILLFILYVFLKRWPIIPIIVLIVGSVTWFVGWGNQPVVNVDEPLVISDENEDDTENNTEGEETQMELSEQLKEEAIEANYVDMISEQDIDKYEKVYIEGIVLEKESDDTFANVLVSTIEDPVNGSYIINIADLNAEFKKGDIIRAYGVYDGINDKYGFPYIMSLFIENIDFDKNNSEHVELKQELDNINKAPTNK